MSFPFFSKKIAPFNPSSDYQILIFTIKLRKVNIRVSTLQRFAKRVLGIQKTKTRQTKLYFTL